MSFLCWEWLLKLRFVEFFIKLYLSTTSVYFLEQKFFLKRLCGDEGQGTGDDGGDDESADDSVSDIW